MIIHNKNIFFHVFYICTFIIVLTPSYAFTGDDIYLDDLKGVRSLSMGGTHYGIGTSNDAIFFNPATMALSKRVSLDIAYRYQVMKEDHSSHISVLDSTKPVSLGLAYIRSPSYKKYQIAIAQRVISIVSIAITGKTLWSDIKFDSKNRLYALDASMAIKPGDHFSLGFTYHNIYQNTESFFFKKSLGMGIGFINLGNIFNLGMDMFIDISEEEKKIDYHLGAEIFLAKVYVLRSGYEWIHRHINNRKPYMSFGIGIIDQFASIELGYKQLLENSDDREFVISFKFFSF